MCLHCSGSIAAKRGNPPKGRPAVYCSRLCSDRARAVREAAVAVRRTDSCEECGGNMEHKRRDARFCSPKCGNDSHNRETAESLLAGKANRPPCRGCGGVVAAARKGNAEYCSNPCKIASRRHQAYGLSLDELTTLLAQHERCAICGMDDWGPPGPLGPQVDHDHATGKVRGVLCLNCNNGLGRFGDDPVRLRAAIAYLEGSAS